ncbi:hypothetical protein JM84_1430 [Dokdonia sp. Hel_I_63]|jgi:hypothetical protein|uniref:hypothetical protein n=1 Tax=Dokdonia sp. Hel_I_63 TaxID=1249996 RepID=UPI00119C2119|nr:hypothetical protein [Dokdonia sp. Hel_I_63]TVZ22527.1 hypothetical protein JM84_1430 [Dokdonia sp. Hel_I_63]
MKNSLKTIFLLVTLFAFHTATGQENFEKTTLVKNIFSALKSQDDTKVIESLATKEEISYLIPIVQANSSENIPEVATIVANFKTEAAKDFQEVLRKGTTFDVQWEDIQLQTVRHEPLGDNKIAIEMADIILVCSSNNVNFEVTLRKSIKIKDNWRLMDRMKFRLL